MKKVLFEKEFQDLFLNGVNTNADAVGVSMGAKGLNALIDEGADRFSFSKDGVSISRSITLSDPVERMASDAIKKAAEKTVYLSGDGTTATTVLARAIFTKGLESIREGANPVALRAGIEKAVAHVVDKLNSMAVPVIDDIAALRNVATISANGDEELGDLIADTIHKIGKDGKVSIKTSNTTKTHVSIVEGYSFHRGYLSPGFANEEGVCAMKNVRVLITNYEISKLNEIFPDTSVSFIGKVLEKKESLLIICNDMNGEVLATLVKNKQKQILNTVVVHPPLAPTKEDIYYALEDLAIATGANIISEDKGSGLKEIAYEDLGYAQEVRVTPYETIIIGGDGSPAIIEKRADKIRQDIESMGEGDYREYMRQRLASLKSSVATIHTGGFTELEISEKKDRVEDSIGAVFSAMEEGVVPGAGMTLATMADLLDNLDLTGDEKIGMEIIKKAMIEPATQILKNAGISYNDIISRIIVDDSVTGYDVRKGEYCNLLKRGILDPKKVVRVSLENAASVAILLLTTKVVIANY